MACGETGRSVDVGGAVFIAFLCIATVMGTGCSTTSGPSQSGDDTPSGMVLVPAGSFVMGDGVATNGIDERNVTLTRDLYLGQYEVTNQEYLNAVQWAYDNGYVTATTSSVLDNLDGSAEELLELGDDDCEIAFSGGVFSLRDAGHGINPDHPVIEVTWYGAARYCDWLSLQEEPLLDRAYEHSGDWSCNDGDPCGAEGYRLPTDAEWEYAAQYNDERIYPWGNESPGDSLANYGESIAWTSPVRSCPVGNSSLGLSDMAGNVFECCNDWLVDDLGTLPETDPPGPSGGVYRVIHGGSWASLAEINLQCAYRGGTELGDGRDNVGFRVARTVHP